VRVRVTYRNDKGNVSVVTGEYAGDQGRFMIVGGFNISRDKVLPNGFEYLPDEDADLPRRAEEDV
jgi:hypothetical protein